MLVHVYYFMFSINTCAFYICLHIHEYIDINPSSKLISESSCFLHLSLLKNGQNGIS